MFGNFRRLENIRTNHIESVMLQRLMEDIKEKHSLLSDI
jgi:hypothetical protein